MGCRSFFYKVAIVMCLMICGGLFNYAYSQTEYLKKNGKTYVYDNAKKRVYNQSQLVKATQKYESEGFDVLNCSIVADTFKKTLSADRLKEHSHDMVAVTFVCSKDGKIDNVKFVFAKTPFLSVDEIESLEQSFLSQRFNILSNLEEGQNIIFTIPCFFSRIQKEE